MRSLTAARLVLLDSDPVRRDDLARTLSQFDAFNVVTIATVAEAANAAGSTPDLFIVEGPSLAANVETGSISKNPFAASGVPTVLLLSEATNEQRRLALRAGYSVVLGAPVEPRLLYRRIAHLLQIARRAKRRALQGLQESRKGHRVELVPVETATRVKVPAG